MTESQEDIVARQQRKHQLWRLSEKQEVMNDDPVAVAPDEYVCPICYEEMADHEHRPMILFPCGHSLCEDCLKRYMASGAHHKCPVCNTPFKSSAVNYALGNAIRNRANEKTGNGIDFQGSLKVAKERLALFLQQLQVNDSRNKVVKRGLDTETKVMDVLDEELRFVREQHAAQRSKVDMLLGESTKLEEEREKLKTVIDPLVIEVQKLELLVQGTSQ